VSGDEPEGPSQIGPGAPPRRSVGTLGSGAEGDGASPPSPIELGDFDEPDANLPGDFDVDAPYEPAPLDLTLSTGLQDALEEAEASADAEVAARRLADDPNEGYTARRRRMHQRRKPPTRGAAPPPRPATVYGAHEPLLATLRAGIDARAHEAVAPFVDRLLALPERAIRAHVVAERLRRMDAHLCLALLRGLVLRSATRDLAAQEVLLDLTTTRPLAEALGYRTARALYELAHARGVAQVARMFLSPEALAGAQPSAFFWQQDNKALPDMSLGWRKKLARGNDRFQLDRLLHDKNLQVIGLLLDNPRLIERDIVRMAAMRPANPDGLLAIFRHRKWISRYRVKVALAANPYTPTDVALACLPHLLAPELRWVASTSTLDESVTSQAGELLRMRGLSPVEREVSYHLAETGRGIGAVDGEHVDLDLDALAKQLENWSADRD